MLPHDAEILHGACRGADLLAARMALAMNETGEKAFIVRPFQANWRKYGKAAGPIRNRKMLDEKPDLVIAFHADLSRSRGTKDCVEEALRRGLKVSHVAS